MAEQEENEKKITKCMMDLVKLYAKDKKPIDADLDMFGVHYKLSFTAEPSKQKEETKCITANDGRPFSEYLQGVEKFIKKESKITLADKEKNGLFIMATDSDQVICAPIGYPLNIISGITSAMNDDLDIAFIVMAAAYQYHGDNIVNLIKKVLK